MISAGRKSDNPVSEFQVEEARRAIISSYELINGVNLYGIFPIPSLAPEFQAAKKMALAWAKEKRKDLVKIIESIA